MFHVKTKKTFCYLMMGGLGLFFWEQNLLLATDLTDEKIASPVQIPASTENTSFPQTFEEIEKDFLNFFSPQEELPYLQREERERIEKARKIYGIATINNKPSRTKDYIYITGGGVSITQKQACCYLANLYDSSEVFPPNHKIAAGWYALAAEYGDVEAYYRLSQIYNPSAYTEDFGLPKDAAKSREFLSIYQEKWAQEQAKKELEKELEKELDKKPNYNFKVNQRSKELLKPFSD